MQTVRRRGEAPSRDASSPSPPARPRWSAVDVVVVVALLVTAVVTRRPGLPHDGLFFDDAVTGVGTKASPSELLAVGFDHPAFTVLLTAWTHVVAGSAHLADLAFVAGTLGPAVLYLALRRFGYSRSIAALLGAALVASYTDALYAGRVKTYTVDLLLVLGLAAVFPRLAAARWRWFAGVAWVAVALALASWSAFAMVAVVVAGVLLVCYHAGDLRVRAAAVGAQLVCTAGLFVAVQRTYDGAVLASQWKRRWDAFVGFDLNPARFAADVLRHLRRVTIVFPGGVGWWTWVWIAAVVAGLAVAALARGRGREALRARYLGLVLLAGLGASIVGNFPFGPKQTLPRSPGGRATLWLIPVVAFGLAVALEWLRRRTASRPVLRRGFDALAFVLAAVVLIGALGRDIPAYPFPGSRSSTRYVVAQLRRDDAVFLSPTSSYPFALESGLSVWMARRPASSIGFVPQFHDARLHVLELDTTPREVDAAIRGAHRVFVHVAEPGVGPGKPMYVLALALRLAGFTQGRTLAFGDARVAVWTR